MNKIREDFMSKTILIVEDNDKLRKTVKEFLEFNEYLILEAVDGEEGIAVFEESIKDIDLVLLDIMLPGIDGQEVLKKIREVSAVPVIMMTAKSGDVEQIKSFGNGVDDYIKKPFQLMVLKARIDAMFKRAGRGGSTIKEETLEPIEVGKLKLDVTSRKAYVDGKLMPTTPKEFDILVYLAENESVALKREQILDAVWGQDYDGTFRTVDTVIKQIRNKMGKKCPYIRSIYGVGYIFEVSDD